MNPLHGRHHAQLPEARDVGRAQVLRVLHPPAQVLLFGMLAKHPLVDVQHLAVGPVADGVNTELIPVLNGQLRGLADIGRVFGVQAAALRLVGVRLEQPRAARPQRAIHLPLDGADGEIIPARSDGAVAVEVRRKLLVRGPQHHPHAQPQFVALGHAPEHIYRRQRRSRIFERGDALGETLVRGQANHLAQVRSRRPVNPVHQPLGLFAQQPGRVALLVF